MEKCDATMKLLRRKIDRFLEQWKADANHKPLKLEVHGKLARPNPSDSLPALTMLMSLKSTLYFKNNISRSSATAMKWTKLSRIYH